MSKRVQKDVPKLMAFSLSPKYYFRRGDHYWFCFTYPIALRQHLRASELRFSLKTTSKDYARYCASAISLKLKKVMKKMNSNITHSYIKSIASQWLQDSINDAEKFYAQLPEMNEREWSERYESLQEGLSDARETLSLNKASRTDRITESLLREESTTFPASDTQLLRRELAKAKVKLVESHIEILSGLDVEALKHIAEHVQARSTSDPSEENISHSPLLSELIDKYVAVKIEAGDWQGRTAMQQEAVLKLFLRINGDTPIKQLSRDDVRDYRVKIQRLPPNINKNPKSRGKTIEEILKLELKPMSAKTSSQSLERVSTFLNWLVNEGFIEKNPAKGTRIKSSKKTTRLPFELNELQTLFANSTYGEQGFDTCWHYWIPLMGAFSGARLGELAQLQVDDIRQEDNVWMMHFVEDDRNSENARTLKTDAAQRRVPIHSTLIRLGFLEYLEGVRKTGNVQLFPCLIKGGSGWSHYPSRWFAEYRKGVNIVKPGKVFHSFRHSVMSNLLNNSKFPREHVQELLGHEHDSVAYNTYFHGLSSSRLQEMVEALQWPIDLDQLIGKWKRYRM